MNREAISVVIPNYNGQHLLAQNLPAVIKTLHKGDQLIVIDDASSDNSVSWLKKEFADKADQQNIELVVLENKKNLRFGASCNKAVKAAKHRLVFLLNNDVSPHPDCVQNLVKHFADDGVFGVGCMEVEVVDGKKIYHGKNKLWFERGLFIHSKAKDMKSGPTAWVIGGSGMFDRNKWLQLGGFDKLYYPAYWEDIDLSFRARKRGWQVLFEQSAVVDHNHESTNRDVFGTQKLVNMSWRNGSKFTWKNGDVWQKIAYLLWRPYWWYQRLLSE